jgi:cupin 2 domain-containing protein
MDQDSMSNTPRNLLSDIPQLAEGEFFEDLLRRGPVRIERIVSSELPEPVLYDQPQDEWVLLLQGEARVWVAGLDVALVKGDSLFIPARTPHRVLSTSGDPPCVWVAVHMERPTRAA